jgi:hypothetical protein
MEIIGDGPVDPVGSARAADRPGGWLGRGTGGRDRFFRRLWILVAVLLVGGAVGAAAFYRAELDAERRRTPDPTPAQRAAVAAVLAWAHALDGHDVTALDAGIVADAGILIITPRQPPDQPFRGGLFLDGNGLTYPSDLRFQVLGRPQAVQELQVTLTGRLSYGDRSIAGQLVVNLEPRLAGVKVSAVVMTTAPTDRLPSEG